MAVVLQEDEDPEGMPAPDGTDHSAEAPLCRTVAAPACPGDEVPENEIARVPQSSMTGPGP